VQRCERGAKDTEVLAAAAGRRHDAPPVEPLDADPKASDAQEDQHGHD
jgi:hypothetical protein